MESPDSQGRVQSHHWWQVLGKDSLGNGHTGTGSSKDDMVPSSVGLLYLWSADSIRKGTANGLEAALGMFILQDLMVLPC